MPTNTNIPLTKDTARDLSKQIVKDNGNVRVKQGRTNGRIVLHVFVPGENDTARTIKSAHEWGSHPANVKAKSEAREKIEDELVITEVKHG